MSMSTSIVNNVNLLIELGQEEASSVVDEENDVWNYTKCHPLPYMDVINCTIEEASVPFQCPSANAGAIVFIFLIMLVLALAITGGNSLIIIVIVRNRTFHNPFNYFKVSLAVADLIIGLFVLPVGLGEMSRALFYPFEEGGRVEVIDMQASWNEKEIVVKTLPEDNICFRMSSRQNTWFSYFCSVTAIFSVMASIFSLVLLSADRFYAVYKPIRYSRRRTSSKKTFIAIGATWVFCIFTGAVFPGIANSHFKSSLIANFLYNMEVNNAVVGTIYMLLALLIPYISMLALNAGTAFLLMKKWMKHTRKISIKTKSLTSQQRSRKEIRATVTLLLMVTAFTITTFPSIVGLCVQMYQNPDETVGSDASQASLVMVMIMLLVSNSACNFLIYSLRCDDFRDALKKMMCGRRGWIKSISVSVPQRRRRRKSVQIRSVSWTPTSDSGIRVEDERNDVVPTNTTTTKQ